MFKIDKKKLTKLWEKVKQNKLQFLVMGILYRRRGGNVSCFPRNPIPYQDSPFDLKNKWSFLLTGSNNQFPSYKYEISRIFFSVILLKNTSMLKTPGLPLTAGLLAFQLIPGPFDLQRTSRPSHPKHCSKKLSRNILIK